MNAAILPSIATFLGASIEAAGQLVTIFALTYAVSSPLLTALTAHATPGSGRRERGGEGS